MTIPVGRRLRAAAWWLAAVSIAAATSTPSHADSLATVPPVGAGPYAVGCSSVEQDFSRVPQGESPEAWWEGVPAARGRRAT